MVKIKTKKEMSLPELIQWGWDNNIKNEKYICNEYKGVFVRFNSMGSVEFSDIYNYCSEETYTVEVEEEITEDTVIPSLAKTYKPLCIGNTNVLNYRNKSIKDIKDSPAEAIAIYMLHDDGIMTLLWKDGAMME
ncbi:hypothetical protein [Staphylococcus pasteuri]|uniref:hypothetical protein n=1 Tax=Staphylococcus pasteuri TaxID=45972 RepID=UPI0012B6F5FA|nr:hypothetical protein [Staphylococcus pasteuri]